MRFYQQKKLTIVLALRKLGAALVLGVAMSAAIVSPVLAPLAITGIVATQTACPFSGHITIQNVLKGGDALVDFAVKKERITPEQGEKIKVDFHDAIACAETLTTTLKAIAKDDPQAKQKKFNAWSTAANWCWKPIVLRQNFAKDPQILKVSKLIDAIFAAGVIFYSPSPERAGIAAAPKDEKALEDDLDRRLKELKEAMKVE